MSTFKTIREVAETGLLAEFRLRMMLHQGKLPGITAGKKFLVNVDMLMDQLEKESKAAVTCSNAANEDEGGTAE